jgi:hypothetical protein
MADKAVFAKAHQLTNETVGLDPGSRSDAHVFLNFDKRANETVIANLATIQIGRLDHFDTLAEHDIPNAAFQ